MKRILGIGNALVDVLAQVSDEAILKELGLPKASMQLIDESRFEQIMSRMSEMHTKFAAGGSACNTILALGNLGARPGVIGKVGNDNNGAFFERNCLEHGITPHLLRDTLPTGVASTFITPDGQRTFGTYLGAASRLTPDEIREEWFDDYGYLYIEGYLVQNHDLIERIIRYASGRGLKVCLDMASYNVVEENRDFMLDLINNYVDIVFANEKEAFALTGMEPEAALHFIAERCQIAVVKVGAKGAFVQRNDEVVTIPPLEADVVDTTGAGDMWAAGFLAGLVKGENLEKCGMMGAIVAKNIIEVVGAKMNDQRWNDIHKAIALL